MGWKEIRTVTPTKNVGETFRAIFYSKELGVVTGEVSNYLHWGPHVSVPCFHGEAVEHWGVTHWMPLPPPPTDPQ